MLYEVITVLAVVVGLGLLIALGRAFAAFYVEILWQSHAGYAGVYWKRILWESGVITSYSIHYTKLYEKHPVTQLRRLPCPLWYKQD